jgi:hypothetical protein
MISTLPVFVPAFVTSVMVSSRRAVLPVYRGRLVLRLWFDRILGYLFILDCYHWVLGVANLMAVVLAGLVFSVIRLRVY